ncbi:hypothetical protein [Pseudoalteromonas luteoviolacea]|uniref:hypothetical protein n=1 Tax=Pseudoalteromonas luteoviolacea TaxID=43657 RepID=UPI001B389EAA|nr:hypothetical protein [Pseudoalteromonas luteoviolacea]MBQ4834882.1 hypothetical protein [Pseudoalteromonas luteoviolacea]
MKDIKIGAASNAFWLIGMNLDVANGYIVASLGESPDSEKVAYILFFDELVDVEIVYFDESVSDYLSSFLGLVGDDCGKYVFTTDTFEISFNAQKFSLEEK